MRLFLRFSIRDLLWLTLVVALALSWVVRDSRLLAALEKESQWRKVVRAFQYALENEGWKVEIDSAAGEIELFHKGPLPSSDTGAPVYDVRIRQRFDGSFEDVRHLP
jgi:hypothetical protein